MTLAEGRGVASEIGFCCFDEQNCECTLSEFADSPSFTKTLHKISLNNPDILLLCSGGNQTQEKSRLVYWVQRTFPHLSLVFLPRKYFNEQEGMACVERYGLPQDLPTLTLGLSPKYFCLTAIAATFHHLPVAFSPQTIKFVYQGVEGSLMIDYTTARHLELVINTTQPKDTLLYILDHTKTSMGHRLLRTNLLQPASRLDTIQERLDAVQVLATDEERLFNIQTTLHTLTDLDQTIAFLTRLSSASSESKINHTLCLKQGLLSIQALAQIIPSTGTLLMDTLQKVKVPVCRLDSDTYSLIQTIQQVIHPEVRIQKTSLGLRNQKCYAVKAGVNGLLDVARQVYKEATKDIYDLVTQYSDSYKLDLKLQFNPSTGFFIQLATHKASSLPDLFIHITQRKKTMQFTTLELLQKNNRVNESLAEVYLMSDSVVSDLLQIFQDNINFLYKASEAIALLDMLSSFAVSCLSYDYGKLRPSFSNTLAIRSGRHPILDRILSTPLVANDTFMSLSSNFQFITGPNMSGKSTYLKQVALLNIMAHMGSFIPAEYGSFRLCDQILSRLTNDPVYSDVDTSSFMNEMKETTFILQNVSHSSLVIMDELGRSTSPQDALGIAAAVCETLAQTRAFCLFATHLHPLTKTLIVYPNIVNLQLKVDIRTTETACCLDYQYKIGDGSLVTGHHYGIQTAQLLDLPQEILQTAQAIVKEVCFKEKKKKKPFIPKFFSSFVPPNNKVRERSIQQVQ
ncbi:muts domain V-domain-containing protein [Sporodiniella umbellata]|nr:muts domain V-domain-containing protein [Sporodiniella umbellata]